MDSILGGLNAAQHAAVTSPANVLQVLAPPGSGKTKVLTSRVAYMLREFDYKPWNIICLTFTIKSAREMKERLAGLLGNGTEQKLVLGTFHSVCRRYLVAYGHLIGIKKDFGIADNSDTVSILKRIIRRRKMQVDPRRAQSRISHTKSKGLTYDDLARQHASKRDFEQQEIVSLFEVYQEHLRTSNLLDYDDLLIRCAELLEQHPGCVSNVEAVLVDEFQDTNVVQFDLLRLFAAKQERVTTVGDPDQSIYGWRSAEVKNLKRMKSEYPDVLVINLEENYRSSGAILITAQEVIEQDISRPAKRLSPTHCPGTIPVLRWLPSAEAEAIWIVSEIRRTRSLTGHLLNHGDFAILLRSASLSRLIESALNRVGMPYRMVGGQRFFDRLEVKTLLDYVRVLSEPNNNDALMRIINIPPRGIGATTIKALVEESETKKSSLWSFIGDVLKGYKSSRTKLTRLAELGFGHLRNLIITIQSKMADGALAFGPEEILRHLIRKLDYQGYLKKTHSEDHDARWANVEELVTQASEYRVNLAKGSSVDALNGILDDDLPSIDGLDQQKGNAVKEALSEFLANVALASDGPKEDIDDASATRSLVTISTIHAAKGLEWPVVFVPSAYEGCIPHSRAEDHDEERRLLYVAMTRAQGLLYMSIPTRNSAKDEVTPSPFLSSKQVKKLLCNQGPAIDTGTVVDLCSILRRPCPSRADIDEACSGLRSRNDDLWPLTLEEWEKKQGGVNGCEYLSTAIADVTQDSHPANGMPSTRAHCTISTGRVFVTDFRGVTVGQKATMDNRASFTLPSGSAGFSTASVQLQRQNKMGFTETRRALFRGETNGRSVQITKTAVPLKAQAQDLFSFWAKETGRYATQAARTGLASRKATGIPSFQASRSPLKAKSSNVCKQSESNPRKRTIGEVCDSATRGEKKPFVLLPSSPPPPEEVQYQAAAPTTTEARPCGSASGWGTQGKLKKALGIRRSMAGWSTRSNPSFVPPSMASMQG